MGGEWVGWLDTLKKTQLSQLSWGWAELCNNVRLTTNKSLPTWHNQKCFYIC